MNPALIGLIMTVASTALKMAADSKAARRAERERAEAQRRQSEYQTRASAAVDRAARDYEPPVRQERQAEAEGQIVRGYEEDLGRARAQAEGMTGPSVQGRVSEDFLAAKAADTARRLQGAADFARLLGKVRAPGRLRSNEAFDRADLGVDLGQYASFARGQYGADQLKIQEAGRVNPLVYGAGGLLQGVGQGIASGTIPVPGGTPKVDPYASSVEAGPTGAHLRRTKALT